MTLTLTPELTQAIEERAKAEGTTPDCAALLALERVFVDGEDYWFGGTVPVRMEWHNLITRRSELIEKQIIAGLTAEETQELARLDSDIDNNVVRP